MAAKRKYKKPKPPTNLPYAELLPTQQNAAYVKALLNYSRGEGPNPGSKGDFHRAQLSAK